MIIESPQSARERFLILGCLVALILLAFTIRAYDLDGKSIWSDEGLSLYRARKSPSFILSGRIVIQGVPTQDTQPPLYFLLLHGLMAVAGTSTFVARYFSVLAGLLVVPSLYVLGRRLVGREAGLWAALIGAVSPLYLWYAQEIRMYTLLMPLSIVSAYALVRTVEDVDSQLRWRWGAAYLMVTAAALYTHYTTFFLLGFQGLYLIAQAVRRRRWRMLAPVGVAGLITLPAIPFVFRRLGLGAERDFHFVPLWIMLRDLWNGFSLGLSVDFYRVYPVDLVFLLLFGLGLLTLLRRRRESGLFLLGYLLLPILSLYVVTYVKPLYQGVRHLMIVSPAYYLLLGAGLRVLHRRFRPALILGVTVILLGAGFSTHNYFTDPAYLKDDLRGLARYFESHRGPDDALILNDAVLTLAFQYYLGQDAPLEAVPRFGKPLRGDFPDRIRDFMDRYDRLWFMSPHRPVRAWLDQELFQSDEVYFEGMNILVMVEVYESDDPRLAEAPDGLRGPAVTLDRALAFHGYTTPHDPVVAGDVVPVNLFWEPERSLDADYKVSLTLVDGEGNAWGAGDAAPFRGLHPTSTWQPGVVLRQRHELTVNAGTPPGAYRLQLQVYDPVTGRRLVADGGAPVDLGGVQVVRPAVPRPPRAVSPLEPGEANFDGRMRLLGIDLATKERRPGDDVHLSTYWQALRDLRQDYRLRLRLVGADGRVLREKVVPPSAAGYPTSRWRSGDVLKGQHRFVVPADAPAGAATIRAGIVTPDGRPLTLRRLWWLPLGGTEAHLTTLQIAPREDVMVEPPAMDQSLDAELAGGIHLLGYDLNTSSAAAGDALPLKLYWRADEAVGESYKVTVQLLSANDEVVAQHDSVPAGWDRPTTGWLPGEVIPDPHTLTIASETPSGRYQLIAAMYDPADGSRLPVTQDGEPRGHVVLATVVVEEDGTWTVKDG